MRKLLIATSALSFNASVAFAQSSPFGSMVQMMQQAAQQAQHQQAQPSQQPVDAKATYDELMTHSFAKAGAPPATCDRLGDIVSHYNDSRYILAGQSIANYNREAIDNAVTHITHCASTARTLPNSPDPDTNQKYAAIKNKLELAERRASTMEADYQAALRDKANGQEYLTQQQAPVQSTQTLAELGQQEAARDRQLAQQQAQADAEAAPKVLAGFNGVWQAVDGSFIVVEFDDTNHAVLTQDGRYDFVYKYSVHPNPDGGFEGVVLVQDGGTRKGYVFHKNANTELIIGMPSTDLGSFLSPSYPAGGYTWVRAITDEDLKNPPVQPTHKITFTPSSEPSKICLNVAIGQWRKGTWNGKLSTLKLSDDDKPKSTPDGDIVQLHGKVHDIFTDKNKDITYTCSFTNGNIKDAQLTYDKGFCD